MVEYGAGGNQKFSSPMGFDDQGSYTINHEDRFNSTFMVELGIVYKWFE